MTYAHSGPDWVEISGAFTLDGNQYAENWVSLVSDEARAAAGVVEITETDLPDTYGLRVTGSSLEDVDGVPTRTWSTQAIDLADLKAGAVATVNTERDTRIAGGFSHDGHSFQTRQSDRENIATLGVQAQLAVLGGAQPGDLHWHGDAENPFRWITADNSTVDLDAQAMEALFRRGVAFKGALTFYARGLKDALLAAPNAAAIAAILAAAAWPA